MKVSRGIHVNSSKAWQRRFILQLCLTVLTLHDVTSPTSHNGMLRDGCEKNRFSFLSKMITFKLGQLLHSNSIKSPWWLLTKAMLRILPLSWSEWSGNSRNIQSYFWLIGKEQLLETKNRVFFCLSCFLTSKSEPYGSSYSAGFPSEPVAFMYGTMTASL